MYPYRKYLINIMSHKKYSSLDTILFRYCLMAREGSHEWYQSMGLALAFVYIYADF
jgi:hypothetical protein